MIKNKYDKTYEEIYAWLTLAEIGFFDIPFSANFIDDKPDLQVGNVGVEVTQFFVHDDKNPKAYDIVNKIGHLPPREKREELKRIDKKELHKNYLVDEGVYEKLEILTSEEQRDGVLKAINAKIIKCASYKKFDTMGVFVSVDSSPYNFSDWQSCLPKNSCFDVIFIHKDGSLYKWENNSLIIYRTLENMRDRVQKAHDLRLRYFDDNGKRKQKDTPQ